MGDCAIVDFHAHGFPPAYQAELVAAGLAGAHSTGRPGGGGGSFTIPPEDMAGRLALMEAAGVGRQMLSPTVAPYMADRAAGVRAARCINESLSGWAAAHPGRLSFYVSLPLPHVDAALDELERGLALPGAAGVVLGCSCIDRSIAHPDFDLLYDELGRRGALVFLHPCQTGLGAPLINDWGLTVCAGASIEDSIAALHLVARRIPERHPAIRFIVPHLGGMLPLQLARLDNQMPRAADAPPPSSALRRFWYDTVGHGSAPALRAAVEAFGADRLVPGSDYPVLLRFEDYAQSFAHICDAGLPGDAVERILFRNATALLQPSRSRTSAA
jgi:aminocarboxymuconate-semialdehyde decarboxylase